MSMPTPFPKEKLTPEHLHYKNFLEPHVQQLLALEFPKELYQHLYHKLTNEIFDAGEHMQLNQADKHSMRPNLLPLYAKKEIKAESDVFLIDQLYTTMERAIDEQVTNVQKVRDACVQLMHLDVPLEKGEKPISRVAEQKKKASSPAVEFNKIASGSVLTVRGGIESIQAIDSAEALTEENKKQMIAIDLTSNNLTDLSAIVDYFKPFAQQIKSINLSANPTDFSVEELFKAFPNAELVNGELTKNYTAWAFCFLAGKVEPQEIIKLPLNECNIQTWKKDEFAKLTGCVEINVRSSEINQEAIDALKTVPKLRALFTSWKYQNKFYNNEIPQLRKVNRAFTNLPAVPSETELLTAFVKDNFWKFAETYTLQQLTYDPVWYLMDVVGLSIDNGNRLSNFKIAPFYYVEKQECYTLMWPVKDVASGEKITRDFSYGASDIMRTLFNLIWHPETPLPEASKPEGATGGEFVNPKKKSAFDAKPELIPKNPDKKNFKVCCDSKLVRDAILTPHPSGNNGVSYSLVGSFSEADILWIVHDHYTNPMSELPKGQFINQYQHEHNLTSKPYFSIHSQGKPWAIESYFMGSEEYAYNFVKEYKRREREGEHNIWIVKPSNLTRSQGIVVTDNLSCILKWMNTPGDIVTSLYMEKPVLFKKRKFDLRYIILVDSVYPELKIYAYDRFKARVAPEDFALNDLSNFKKHFTVQQYTRGGSVSTTTTNEFIEEWNNEHKDMPYEKLEAKILSSIRDMFVSVQDKLSDDGHLGSPHCKALYGVDVMIEDGYQPKILECNFSPDTSYFQNMSDRNFFREVFDFLFTGRQSDSIKEIPA